MQREDALRKIKALRTLAADERGNPEQAKAAGELADRLTAKYLGVMGPSRQRTDFTGNTTSVKDLADALEDLAEFLGPMADDFARIGMVPTVRGNHFWFASSRD